MKLSQKLYKNTNVCMIKVFSDMKKDTAVKAVEKEIGLEEGRYC